VILSILNVIASLLICWVCNGLKKWGWHILNPAYGPPRHDRWRTPAICTWVVRELQRKSVIRRSTKGSAVQVDGEHHIHRAAA